MESKEERVEYRNATLAINDLRDRVAKLERDSRDVDALAWQGDALAQRVVGLTARVKALERFSKMWPERCPECTWEVPRGWRVTGACGRHMATEAEQPKPDQPPGTAGERAHVNPSVAGAKSASAVGSVSGSRPEAGPLDDCVFCDGTGKHKEHAWKALTEVRGFVCTVCGELARDLEEQLWSGSCLSIGAGDAAKRDDATGHLVSTPAPPIEVGLNVSACPRCGKAFQDNHKASSGSAAPLPQRPDAMDYAAWQPLHFRCTADSAAENNCHDVRRVHAYALAVEARMRELERESAEDKAELRERPTHMECLKAMALFHESSFNEETCLDAVLRESRGKGTA